MTDEKKSDTKKTKKDKGPGPESQVQHHYWTPKKD